LFFKRFRVVFNFNQNKFFMKNAILSAIVLGAVSLTSCDSNEMDLNTAASPIEEATASSSQINLSSSDYERVITSALVREADRGAYKSGVIEYRENGTVSERVDFGKGKLGKAEKTDKEGNKEDLDLEKKKDKASKYEKVILEPIVKTDDCDYIVAGIIEFYESGELVATIDFGDGNCDDIATKTSGEEVTEFSMDDRKDKREEDKSQEDKDRVEGDEYKGEDDEDREEDESKEDELSDKDKDNKEDKDEEWSDKDKEDKEDKDNEWSDKDEDKDEDKDGKGDEDKDDKKKKKG
jgi:hypothetical protein